MQESDDEVFECSFVSANRTRAMTRVRAPGAHEAELSFRERLERLGMHEAGSIVVRRLVRRRTAPRRFQRGSARHTPAPAVD